MAIEIVDFPIKNGGSFHCYVSSPEGVTNDGAANLHLKQTVLSCAGCAGLALEILKHSQSKAVRIHWSHDVMRCISMYI